MPDSSDFEKKLGVSFQQPSLLEQALIHSSYDNENPVVSPGSNERMEFLGDAVLDMVIAQRLYDDLPEATEGELTRLRADLVCRDSLARVARSISLGDFLRLGKGEEGSGGQRKSANLAGAMEAVIAAVFLDRGSAAAADFILRLFSEEIDKAVTQGGEANYKSQLQEYIQARKQPTPSYRTVESEGPDHDRVFTVEVTVRDRVLGRGSGKSKKEAEIAAARAALESLWDSFTP